MRQGSRLLMQVGHHAFCHNLSQADHFHSRIYHLRPFPFRILRCRWGSQFPVCIWIVHVPCADLPEYEAPRYIDRADTLPEANNGCLPCRSIKLTHHKDYIHIVAGADVRAAFDHVTSKSRTSGTVSCFWERSAAVMPHFRVWMWWVAFVLFSARKLSMFLIIPQGTVFITVLQVVNWSSFCFFGNHNAGFRVGQLNAAWLWWQSIAFNWFFHEFIFRIDSVYISVTKTSKLIEVVQ